MLELGPGRADPYPIYAAIRGGAPLARSRDGRWVTADHAVCAELLRERRVGVRPAGDLAPRTGVANPFDLSFLYRDPPDHGRLKRLASPAFTSKKVLGYTGRIESTVNSLLDAAAAAEHFDLVGDFAAQLPIAVMSDLLGIEDGRGELFLLHATAILAAIDGIQSVAHARRLAVATTDLNRLFASMIEERRSNPGEDVVSSLVSHLGAELTENELSNIVLVVARGRVRDDV